MKDNKSIIWFVVDIIILALSYFIAFEVRFEALLPLAQFDIFLNTVIYVVLIKLLVNYIFKIYFILWQYASTNEALRIISATFISSVTIFIVNNIFSLNISRSIIIVSMIFDILLISFSRLSPNYLDYLSDKKGDNRKLKRVAIIGAGIGGVTALAEINQNKKLRYNPVCFIDDDTSKVGKIIKGIKVIGTTDELGFIKRTYKIKKLILAIPSLNVEEKTEIVNKANEHDIDLLVVPSLFSKKDSVSFREVNIEDLLERDVVNVDEKSIKELLKDKVCLISGGGGTIGSELCRQVVEAGAKKVIIFDIYENNIYDLQNELKDKLKDTSLIVLIESIRNKEGLDDIFKEYRPDIVFHAAAHKHVPLMEESVKAAVLNNIFGTYNMAELSDKYKVKNFVQISTDKAVNPTNVMGATKRVDELIIQAFNDISETDFLGVRFGNVLGSSGSVIPLFIRQINNGGPITLTHRDMTRYFMTIKEACHLVLKACSIADGGEIFILDMGKPVKIYDLATKMISISGKKDIKIKEIGPRPGEKLYEELILDKEKALKTKYEKIFIDTPKFYLIEELNGYLAELKELLKYDSKIDIIKKLMEIVPEYKPNNKDFNSIK